MERFKDGNILSLLVKDFQTFSDQRFVFGPSLNLIAGPNGSGKSSIANAIALVLNGTPRTIGKSKDIADFIRFGCSEAVISAEIHSGERAVVLSRKISVSHNHYFIDDRLVTQREYFGLLSGMRIDVNNLCTFLPQERVSEFCRMDSRELLVEMLRNTPVNLDKVKDLHARIERASTDLSTTERQKKLVEDTISVLESSMKGVREREESTCRLQRLEHKRALLEWERCRDQYSDIKKDMAVLSLKIRESTAKIDDCEIRIREKESSEVFLKHTRGVGMLLSQNKELVEVHDNLRALALKLEMLRADRDTMTNRLCQRRKSAEDKAYSVEELRRQLFSSRDEIYREIQGFRSKASALYENSEYRDLMEPCSATVDRAVTKVEELQTLVPSLTIAEEKRRAFRESIEQIQNTSHRIQKQIEELEQQKLSYSERGNVRMEMLKKYHHDTYRGVLWLRENRHVFREEVLEPCYLHLVLDKEYSDYAEAFLSFQALSSFIARNDDDFGRLTKILKDEMGLSINAVVLGTRKVPGLSVKEVESFGLDGVLSDFIECRQEYMDFLNSYGHFNSIPISKREIKEEDVFRGLPLVKRMAAGGRYSEIKKSRYGGDYVIVTSRISGKGLFIFPRIDIEHISKELADLNKERERNKVTLERILMEKMALDAKAQALMKELDISHITKLFFMTERLTRNIEFIESEIKELSDAGDVELDKVKLCIAQAENDASSEARRLHDILDPASIPVFDLEGIKDLKLDLENDRRSMLFLKHAKEMDEASLGSMSSTKTALKAKMTELKQQTPFPPMDSADLPDNALEIDGEIAFLRAKLDMLPNQSYARENCKEKEDQLNAISETIDDLKKTKMALEEELSHEKTRAVAEVYRILSPVNDKFKEMFRKLGFEGRLELGTSNEAWELKILVRFRDCEDLQELSSFRQSGGEKSLTTVLFLLALQQCENMPFRLVDEINQGMDPYNERVVFEILREMGDRSQFFIITPKLVEGMVLSENTRALIVYGGPGITKDLETYAHSVLNGDGLVPATK